MMNGRLIGCVLFERCRTGHGAGHWTAVRQRHRSFARPRTCTSTATAPATAIVGMLSRSPVSTTVIITLSDWLLLVVGGCGQTAVDSPTAAAAVVAAAFHIQRDIIGAHERRIELVSCGNRRRSCGRSICEDDVV